ncbi:MAG: glycoprotein [Frankliniella intonsa rhabdovirus 1]|uniref:Glycoprotein n=1 Tax=Frankliniella intonsa rhabdovirus 1 TaxID=3070917 RepID=A0A8K1XCG3_9RHAB|nr:MAG: glycoprotein [Frankliniella intonsa rhabdovirus 1]UHK03325.1 MAG: glycoprotein [Frankliniella intonsa rhabdovirus 1]
MMRYLLALILTLSLLPPSLQMSIQDGPKYVGGHIIPLDRNLSWHAAHPSEIDCRYASRHRRPDWPDNLLVQAKEHVFGSATSVDGWLCHKTKLITRCSVTWYLASETSHLVEDQTPSLEECQAKIRDRAEGVFEDEIEFPLPNCGWNAQNDEHQIKYTLTPHKSFFDPIAERVRDSILPGGQCDSDVYCRTIYASTIWVMEADSAIKQCQETVNKEIIFKQYQGNVTSTIFVPGSGIFSRRDFCLGNVCDEPAIITSFGESFTMDVANIALLGTSVNTCDRAKLKTGSRAMLSQEKVTMIEDQIGEIKCRMAVNKLKSGMKLMPSDLYAIAPKTTGFHPVFKVINQTLWGSHAKYILAEPLAKSKAMGECELGRSSSLGVLQTDYWVPVSRGVKMTYGGLLCVNGSVSTPIEIEISENLMELEVRPWLETYHPAHGFLQINGTIHTVSEARHDGENVLEATGEAVSNGARYIGNAFSSIFNAFYLIIPIGGCFAIVFCSWYCCSCICARRAKNKSNKQIFYELEAFQQAKRRGMHPF